MPPKRRRIPQVSGRWFSITWNNPPEDVVFPDYLVRFDGTDVTYVVGQLERGDEEGTLHLQAACRFCRTTTWRAARTLIQGIMEGAHVEVAKSPTALREYVTKERTRVSGPYSWGEGPQQGMRTDLAEVRDLANSGSSVMDIAGDYPAAVDRARHLIFACQMDYFKRKALERYDIFCTTDARKKVRFLWGPPRTGKTRAVFEHVPREDLYELRKDNKGTAWFDDYHGEKALLLDDYLSYLPVALFLRLTDIYPVRVSIKGAFTYLCFEEVYICSNQPPELVHGKVTEPVTRAAVASRLEHQSAVLDAKVLEFTEDGEVPELN